MSMQTVEGFEYEKWDGKPSEISGRIADGVTECPFTSLITATVLCQRGFQEFALQSRKFNASIRPCQGVCSHLKRILRCQ